MKEKIHCLWFEMIVIFGALSDFQIFHKHKKSLVMRIASLQECFAILGKIKGKENKEDGPGVSVCRDRALEAQLRKTVSSQPGHPALVLLVCNWMVLMDF